MLKFTPILTEYSYSQVKDRVYMVKAEAVSEKISKISLKTALENQYNVNIESIRISNRKGKAMRFSRGRHAYPGITHHRDQKIVYVTVKEGQRLPFFDEYEKAVAEANEADKKAEAKAAKKVEKTEAKEAKKSAKTADKAEKAEKKGTK
ncbi:MAG: 50S ribosomal protein L23 [Candidatus Saccharibacteria bacterium]|nr:50S ribosomal protein L23 [Candidatus Saccharibacteria bacterium]